MTCCWQKKKNTEEQMKPNKIIRIKAIERGVYFWQIAAKMKISPETLSRMMRKEFSEEKKQEILQAIDDVAAELRKGGDSA
jgi:hypothetical protein